jgi:PilZ domain
MKIKQQQSQEVASHTNIDLDVEYATIKILPERRQHRRCEIDNNRILVERFDSTNRFAGGKPLGHLVNISAGGVCIKTAENNLKIGSQIRIRMTLPSYAGIMPFVSQDGSCRGTNEWSGWMTVVRVSKVDGAYEIAGRMVDMREIDRGMLGLYLSAQPLAA